MPPEIMQFFLSVLLVQSVPPEKSIGGFLPRARRKTAVFFKEKQLVTFVTERKTGPSIHLGPTFVKFSGRKRRYVSHFRRKMTTRKLGKIGIKNKGLQNGNT